LVCINYYFSNWIHQREDKIIAKGKGELITYWLEIKSNNSGRQSSRSSDSATGSSDRSKEGIEGQAVIPEKALKLFDDKTERLIDWNSDVLCRLLQKILSSKEYAGTESSNTVVADNDYNSESIVEIGSNPFDEVKEIIALPQLKTTFHKNWSDGSDVHVPKNVADQLRDYVSHIAALYNDNKFHNFEHVSIVFVGNFFRCVYMEQGCVIFFFRGTYISVAVHETNSNLFMVGISCYYECNQAVVPYCGTIGCVA
jgi:hypothetical protein